MIGNGGWIVERLQALHHFSEHNSSLRGSALERRASYNPLFSKGLSVPNFIPSPFPTG